MNVNVYVNYGDVRSQFEVVIETTDSHLVDSDPVDLGWILAVTSMSHKG